jgi:nucleoside-diphosphate-sugar epimerase
MISQAQQHEFNIGQDDLILITGAAGFIGPKLVTTLVQLGFRNIRCLTRPSSRTAELDRVMTSARPGTIHMVRGNLLSPDDCNAAMKDAAVVFHLAAGRGEKSYADAFLNSVVTTRNLLEACRGDKLLRRFVNISSFAVYSNQHNPHGNVLDEDSVMEPRPELRHDPYCFAKVKQDGVVRDYGERYGIPYVLVRPGVVYGKGNEKIPGRVGTGTFGMFLHLGGSNRIPLTYVDNCAYAVALAGLIRDQEGETFNVVDDNVPTSRQFLQMYKRKVKRFPSLYIPHAVSYMLCYLWERYSDWSEGQLEAVFNRRTWYAGWKKTRYSNDKLKRQLGWVQPVPTEQALERFFEACRNGGSHA